jgi:thioredoxin reductase (NADPH)
LCVSDETLGRALARDLRHRYGAAHQVLRAADPASALRLVRSVLDEGGRISLLLADHTVESSAGPDFLMDALSLAPDARSAFLTSYVEITATLAAMAVLDVDAYVLKPWGPPEERLHPVLDDLLEREPGDASSAPDRLVVLIEQWSPASQDARDFLSHNLVPFKTVDVRSSHGQRLLSLAGLPAGPEAMPVVLTPDGGVLLAPSKQELAREAGLATSARCASYDLVVVGGGPGGLGAAVYGASEGLRTLLVEREATGGQAGTSSRIENYLGFPQGLSGADLSQRARDQALRFGVEIVTAAEVRTVAAQGPLLALTLSDGSEIRAAASVLATGVSYTRLPASAVDAFSGRGLFYGAAAHNAADCAGQDVYVVGAANSAGQAALFFARHAARVTVLCRGAALGQGMSRYLVSRIQEAENIDVLTDTQIVDAIGGEHLERIRLANSRTGTHDWADCSRVFLFIGAAPRTEWLGPEFVRDQHGFIRTGADLLDPQGQPPSGWAPGRLPQLLESSVPGVFVAGDVRATSIKRVAAAVGEGALAVSLVHRHLAASP